jgi:hypothetical protein
MTDPTMARMSFGFAVFAMAVCVWASIDYNRFIKFWMLRPAPYSQRVRIVFRLFFLACVVGGVWHLADTMPDSGTPLTFYLGALLFAAASFLAFLLMLHFLEWMNRKWRIKQSRFHQKAVEIGEETGPE